MPADIVEEKGLAKVKGGEFDAIIASVVEANPQAVGDYLAGKKGALNFLVGQVMKETRGRADPKVLNAQMSTYLDALGE